MPARDQHMVPCTHFSPSWILELASNTLLHLLSSFSGTATAVRTVLRAEAVRDGCRSVSLCKVGNSRRGKRVMGDVRVPATLRYYEEGYRGTTVEQEEREGRSFCPSCVDLEIWWCGDAPFSTRLSGYAVRPDHSRTFDSDPRPQNNVNCAYAYAASVGSRKLIQYISLFGATDRTWW